MTDTKPKAQQPDPEKAKRIDEKLMVLARRLYNPDLITEEMVDQMLAITEPASSEEDQK